MSRWGWVSCSRTNIPTSSQGSEEQNWISQPQPPPIKHLNSSTFCLAVRPAGIMDGDSSYKLLFWLAFSQCCINLSPRSWMMESLTAAQRLSVGSGLDWLILPSSSWNTGGRKNSIDERTWSFSKFRSADLVLWGVAELATQIIAPPPQLRQWINPSDVIKHQWETASSVWRLPSSCWHWGVGSNTCMNLELMMQLTDGSRFSSRCHQRVPTASGSFDSPSPMGPSECSVRPLL